MSSSEQVFVRFNYEPSGGRWYPPPDKTMRVRKWIEGNISYPVDWGFVSGMAVGVYLEPADALIFSLMFSL